MRLVYTEISPGHILTTLYLKKKCNLRLFNCYYNVVRVPKEGKEKVVSFRCDLCYSYLKQKPTLERPPSQLTPPIYSNVLSFPFKPCLGIPRENFHLFLQCIPQMQLTLWSEGVRSFLFPQFCSNCHFLVKNIISIFRNSKCIFL